MHRLLRPGGCLAILEFSRPTNRLWGPLFEFYFRRILPALGNTISGSGQAYSYLQQSVRNFLTPGELASAARSRGFQRVEYYPLSGGISVLHLAYK
jgi:demethylmenaquinone methyltransferase/2-methoxy-6-polyprenyl-1,4-benzoquinol methylase